MELECNLMAKQDPKEISWRAAEFEFREKGPLWYLVIGLVSATLIIVSFAQKNFFFAVFILVASLILMFFGRLRPAVFNFKIGEGGINVGDNKFFTYEKLDGFAIVDRPGRLDEIVIKKKTVINSFLKLPIDSKNAAKAKELLSSKLAEIEYKESIIDIFSNLLKL